MVVREIRAKGILQRSRLPGTDYAINPYTGCVHGCVYCYARFMKRFTGHPEPWGGFLDAKINAPELLERELSRRRTPLAGGVFLSSVTDPYQPPERKFALTRGILETLLRHGVPVSILTKSDLVLRDLDLLETSAGCSVGLSLGVLDDDWGARLEPRAAPPSRRLAALRALRAHGIETWGFVSPFLPGVSDIRRIVEALAGAVDRFHVEAINTGAGNWSGTLAAIARKDPDLARTSARRANDPAYWRGLEDRARSIGRQAGLELAGFYHHRTVRR
jgi:DNA repair photolyase